MSGRHRPRSGARRAWATSDRRARLPPDWSKIRDRVLQRDGHQCTFVLLDETRCPAAATEVDHVERGDDHRPANLASLCRAHHAAKTAAEGHEAQRARRYRDPPTHPGLIA